LTTFAHQEHLSSKPSSKFQHSIRAVATIPCTYFSPTRSRELSQIKFGTSFRLNTSVWACANFREIRKSGEVIRQSRYFAEPISYKIIAYKGMQCVQ